MVKLLLESGADPLAVSSYTKPAPPDHPAASGPAASSSSSAECQPVIWNTTLLHLLLGDDRQQVLGGAPLALQHDILQICLQVAAAEASEQKDRQLQWLQLEWEQAAGSAAEQQVARDKLRGFGAVPQHVLGACVDENGECGCAVLCWG